MTKLKFEDLNLSNEILNAVKDMGFEEASPVQTEAIPLIIQGKDIIGQAQTGTGKTAAFAIPVLEKIDVDTRKPQAIILCPTRELVIQVAEEFRKLTKYRENIFIVPVYGGQEIDRQLKALKKGVHIIIGTPGRTMDHMRRGSINMNSVRTVVLDEADEMLDMGFRDDIETILRDTPLERQTIMFSATMAKAIVELTKNYQTEPVIVNVTHKKLSTPQIHQKYIEVLEKNKTEVLSRLIEIHHIKLALIFCNTKNQVDQLVEVLKIRGYSADALHGNMSQNTREKVMNAFRNGAVEFLVATDVAGRGIDVNNIEAVFNYDIPRDDEDYIHRIGRTARAGKSGLAFTLITGKQIYNLKRIEKIHGLEIHRENVPTMREIELSKLSTYTAKVADIIESGQLGKYINQIELLMDEDYTSLDVAAALLKIILEKETGGLQQSMKFETSFEESKRSDKNFSQTQQYKQSCQQNDRFKKKQKESYNGNKKELRYDQNPYKKQKEGAGKNKPLKQKDKAQQDSISNFNKPLRETYSKETANQKRTPRKFQKNK